MLALCLVLLALGGDAHARGGGHVGGGVAALVIPVLLFWLATTAWHRMKAFAAEHPVVVRRIGIAGLVMLWLLLMFGLSLLKHRTH